MGAAAGHQIKPLEHSNATRHVTPFCQSLLCSAGGTSGKCTLVDRGDEGPDTRSQPKATACRPTCTHKSYCDQSCRTIEGDLVARYSMWTLQHGPNEEQRSWLRNRTTSWYPSVPRAVNQALPFPFPLVRGKGGVPWRTNGYGG